MLTQRAVHQCTASLIWVVVYHPSVRFPSLQMIVEPELRVADFAKAGADIISVHAEQSSTTHLHRVVYQVCALADIPPLFSPHPPSPLLPS